MTLNRAPDAPELSPARPDAGLQRDFSSSLYAELRDLAGRRMRFERADHTLQTTALVHEAYLRLADATPHVYADRIHFLAAAAQVMRHVLVDHARSRRARKRGAGGIQVTLDEGLLATPGASIDVLTIDEALTRLAALDSRQAGIVEMHFFAGMTFEEIAAALGIALRTAKRDWAMARAWLHDELSSKL
ncbi:MAG TPA: ECF-type sigma factor [Acidobacteriaceae bacterium]|nr:ECF-type sigma factor [Acidobacteriaceae bacterium]